MYVQNQSGMLICSLSYISVINYPCNTSNLVVFLLCALKLVIAQKCLVIDYKKLCLPTWFFIKVIENININ